VGAEEGQSGEVSAMLDALEGFGGGRRGSSKPLRRGGYLL
jgi:hypothetical protein